LIFASLTKCTVVFLNALVLKGLDYISLPYFSACTLHIYALVPARARLSPGGAAAEQAAGQKSAKYYLLVQTGRVFQPITAEMLGPLNESCIAFFSELG